MLATQGTTKVYKHAKGVACRPSSTKKTTETTQTLPPPPAPRDGGDGDGGGGGGGHSGAGAYSASEEKTSRDTIQGLAAVVAEDALLVVIPDPVQAFRDSRFRQKQRVRLARGGSLVLVDWVTAGRAEFRGGGAGGFTSGVGGGEAPADAQPIDPRGERWVFSRYATTTEVLVDEEEVLVESLRLEDDRRVEEEDEDEARNAAARPPTLAERMGAVHALATVILVGPRAAATAAHATKIAEPLVKATVAGGAAGRAVYSRDIHAVTVF